MKKIISFILGSIVALNLSMSVANAAANEVRVAFFLELFYCLLCVITLTLSTTT